ncbi:MAG: hypothetical protein IT198_00680 [Acidimicrobiia bacterium]|nr:hypothetical protein [Acidimicrobiia bacterium]
MGETDRKPDAAPTAEQLRPLPQDTAAAGVRAPAEATAVTWDGLGSLEDGTWAAAFPPGQPGTPGQTTGGGESGTGGADAASVPAVVHKHDAPVEPIPNRPRRDLVLVIVGAALALFGLAAAIFGAEALISAGRADADATARADAYAEIAAERADLAEEALTQVFAAIDVADAIGEVLETGEAYRKAADHVIEVTNQAVVLSDEGKGDEANALMAEQGAAAFAAASQAEQHFHEAVTRLQELAA